MAQAGAGLFFGALTEASSALEWARRGSDANMWPVEVRPFLGPPPA
jgi:hypothetical protein